MTSRADDGHPTGEDDHRAEDAPSRPEGSSSDEQADEMSEESFPSSDPPSTWAGPAD